jgi:hypothetical protein
VNPIPSPALGDGLSRCSGARILGRVRYGPTDTCTAPRARGSVGVVLVPSNGRQGRWPNARVEGQYVVPGEARPFCSDHSRVEAAPSAVGAVVEVSGEGGVAPPGGPVPRFRAGDLPVRSWRVEHPGYDGPGCARGVGCRSRPEPIASDGRRTRRRTAASAGVGITGPVGRAVRRSTDPPPTARWAWVPSGLTGIGASCPPLGGTAVTSPRTPWSTSTVDFWHPTGSSRPRCARRGLTPTPRDSSERPAGSAWTGCSSSAVTILNGC